LAGIAAGCRVDYIVVAAQNGPVVHTPGGEYFFHLNLAQLRIKNLKDGKHDHMVTAMDLQPGLTVLDCTLGLATDAIVASFVVGDAGGVTGLEASPLVAAIAAAGLAQFCSGQDETDAALRRIAVRNADHNSYLASLPAASFDVVYFDPMFRNPIHASSNLAPLRYLADSRPLSPAALAAARRVARRRVIVKEANNSPEFRRLGIDTTLGGRYSSIHYGVVAAEGC
jgi:hypothetical protein